MKRLAMVLIAAILVVPAGALAQTHAPAGPPEWTAHPPIHPKGPARAALQPGGYSPAQILTAYGISGTGAGQVIAIVDAYDDPTIASDLGTFSGQFGLPAMTTSGCTAGSTVAGAPHPCFQKVYAQGKPRTDGGWALEISLDVEWAHAIAPGADILLVEAKNSFLSSLLAAVQKATGTAGVRVVSMSWLGNEFSSESSYDSYFPAGNSVNSGIMYTASSGDSGSGTGWPAASPRVLSVGGTTLTTDASGNYVSETAWSGSGGGISTYESEPAYQSGYSIPSAGGKRGIPDVAYDADPNTGVYVYDSTPYNGQAGWWIVGGTSVGAPSWAALIALADQGRSSPLATDPSSSTGSPVYSAGYPPMGTNYAANFHDITTGSNGGCGYYCNAATGYDYVTGLGSPRANNLIPFLVSH